MKRICLVALSLILGAFPAWADSFVIRSAPDNPTRKEAYRVGSDGTEIQLDGVKVAPVGMPGQPVEVLPRYFWFAPQSGSGPDMVLAVPDTGECVALRLPDADLCSDIWISPDGKRLLLALNTAPLSSLAVYDMKMARVSHTVPDAGWPVWMDEFRFACNAFDPVRNRGRRNTSPVSNAWSSVMYCELHDDGGMKRKILYQAMETVDYNLLEVGAEDGELFFLKIVVDSPEEWDDSDKYKVEAIRAPYPAVE